MYGLVVAQAEPLPVGHLLELEFLNALRFKAFLVEMSSDELERLFSLCLDRKRGGQYFAPHLAPSALHELCLMMTGRTPIIGCRVVKLVES